MFFNQEMITEICRSKGVNELQADQMILAAMGRVVYANFPAIAQAYKGIEDWVKETSPTDDNFNARMTVVESQHTAMMMIANGNRMSELGSKQLLGVA